MPFQFFAFLHDVRAPSAGGRWRAVADCVRRARTSLAIMDQLDLVLRRRLTSSSELWKVDFL